MLKITVLALLTCFFSTSISTTNSIQVVEDSWNSNLPPSEYARRYNEKQVFNFTISAWKFPEKHFVGGIPDPYVIHLSYRNGSSGSSKPFLETKVHQNTEEPKWKSSEIQFTEYIPGIRQTLRFEFHNLHPAYLDDEIIGHAYIDIDRCLEDLRSSKIGSSTCQAQIQDVDDGILFFRVTPNQPSDVSHSRSQASLSTALSVTLVVVSLSLQFY